MLKTYEVKPNYSYLGKKYNLDPRTIKKYYEGYEGKPTTRNKSSKLDIYKDIIEEKLKLKGIKISAIHFFLKSEKNYTGCYNSLTHYIRKNFKDLKSKEDGAHVRFETKPGEQMQFDWVESITLISKQGEVFNFNVFSAELSYSRMHYFSYSKTKTREDVINNLIKAFKFYGGLPEGTLTDNMSSIVNTDKKTFCQEFKAFAKDVEINISKCKVKHPFTKGKVEVRNKFMKWLIPYNFEVETEEDITKVIEKINIEVNQRINDTTQIKPILLYQKEKEYLKPLPNNKVLEQYINISVTVKVPNTLLIYYKGNQYSVPKKYINKTLKIKEDNNTLYIYDNTDIVVTHEVKNKKINYKKEHYIEALKGSMLNNPEEEIEHLAKKNLELFDNFIQK